MYWTGQIAPTASLYTSPIIIEETAQIKARVLNGEAWSALTEATFVVEQDQGLQITEIMYNPLGGSDYEFIELKNVSNIAIDLAHLSFTGIDFTFPADTPSLAPQSFAVLVRNPIAFSERYPDVQFLGS